MPSKTWGVLIDLRDNIVLARQIAAGTTLEDFETALVLFYAATRCLEIISEATRRLPADLRDRHPALPWRQIMDAGNFYRHDYGNVSEKFVWRTIQDSLPSLLAVVEYEMEAIGSKDQG